jgi:hypothetical protein
MIKFEIFSNLEKNENGKRKTEKKRTTERKQKNVQIFKND